MTLTLTYWMLRQRDKRSGRNDRYRDTRQLLRAQHSDYKKRGKGNKAYKRADQVLRQLERVTVDPYALARGCL